MKCNICGMEKETRRQMHGHLMHEHYDDYKRGDFVLDRFVTDAPAPARIRKEKKYFPRPEGFRLLRRNNEDEARAIDAGFDFIDAETNIYTYESAKIEGWI